MDICSYYYHYYTGCTETGYYRSNCSIPCPDDNCQYCHIVTGTCQGCKPGHQGQRCELGKYCVMNVLLMIFFLFVIHNR